MPDFVYRHLHSALWIAWALYWWAAARDVKDTRRQESVPSRLAHVLPLAGAIALLWPDRLPWAPLNRPLLPWSTAVFWASAALTAAGLGFAVWARRHIGRNWSGTVTLKEDHQLVDSGPYALVRHPIYTGLLLAIVGSAWARNEWRSVLAVAIAWLSLWRKLKLEEHWMLGQFGEGYAAYCRRVPALIPWTGRTRETTA